MASDPTCLFCKIVAGAVPATVVYRDQLATAFRDIDPQAPTHVLVVPNDHLADTNALRPETDQLLGALLRTAAQVAEGEGVGQSGYRLVLNTGADALNSVPHLHVHVLGGRRLGWPPG
jgi:histidine triad (HIT) family protein